MMKPTRIRFLSIAVIALTMVLAPAWLGLRVPASSPIQAQDARQPADNEGAAKDLTAEVERIVGRIARKHERAWTYAFEIASLAADDEDKAAPLAGLLLQHLDNPDEYVRLVACHVLLSLNTGDEDDAYEVLGELLDHGEEGRIAAMAAGTLAAYPPSDAKAAVAALRKRLIAPDGATPAMLVAFAEAESTLADDETGTERLRGFLAGDDHELAGRAALALAQLGHYGEVQGRLQTLAKESGEQGVLARLLIENEGARGTIRAYRETGSKPAKPPAVVDSIRTVVENYDGTAFEYGAESLALTPPNLVDNAARAMVGSLDPHSEFITAAEYIKSNEDNSGRFAGVGAFVGKSEDDPAVRITQPIYSGPAYRAGLRSGDYLWEVEIGGGARQSLVGLETEDAVKLLRGEPGTKVKIWVKRPGVKGLVQLELTRAIVEVDQSDAEMLPGNIGYVQLKRFNKKSVEDIERQLRELKREGMKGIVLDLRDNPGGLLPAVQAIADLFLDKDKPIALIKGVWDRYKEPDIKRTMFPAIYPEKDFPMVVLINDESASGSELLSGTLKDHKRAEIVGVRSFGKGIGQGFYPITKQVMEDEVAQESGRILKCTIFSYYILPSGDSIDRYDGKGGVEPDVEVHSPLYSSWEFYQLVALRKTEALDTWVREQWDTHKDAFLRIAECDDYSDKGYPGFGELYASLKTLLSREMVRNELRRVIRTRASDERGRPYHTNYEVDYQLQRALIRLGKKMSLKLETIPNYQPFLKDHE